MADYLDQPVASDMTRVDACMAETCEDAPAERVSSLLRVLDYVQRRAWSKPAAPVKRPGITDGAAEFEKWYTASRTGATLELESVDWQAMASALLDLLTIELEEVIPR